MKNLFTWLFSSVVYLSTSAIVVAENAPYMLLETTPIGSWQVRENVDTNHKGKSTGSTIRTSLIGSEMRDGEKHYWVEMVIDSYKISKKGKRKAQGDQMVMKSLIPASLMNGDPANMMGNLRGFGKETIIQSGNNDPMRMSNSGGMMAGIMKSMALEIKYDFQELGSENISVAAGDFDTRKIRGSGTAEAKILFKKIRVESDSTVWLAKNVPFGMVKINGTSKTNGKQSTFKSELIEFGQSGASSLIIKEPQDMPVIPNIFGGWLSVEFIMV